MPMGIDVLNARFVDMLKTAEDREEVALATSLFLRTKIREDSFARQILPPVIISPAECDRSADHRGLVKIMDIEPDGGAAAVDFLGQSQQVTWIYGDRYTIPFFAVSSDENQVTEGELLSYKMPITDLIRKNTELAIAEIEDTKFMALVNAAITTTSKDTDSVAATGFGKKDFTNLFKLLDGDELKGTTVLINTDVYNDILAWDDSDFGDPLLSEVVKNGYTYPILLGKRLVVTNKTSIVADDKIYCFTDQPYLGHAFALTEELKFGVEQRFNLITYKAWEYIGMGIGNARAVASVTLKDEG